MEAELEPAVTVTGPALTGTRRGLQEWDAALDRASRLPPGANLVDLLGVSYAHLRTADGSELYFTHFGLPFWEHLLPENWYVTDWFQAKSERLIGTSLVYRLPTKRLRNLVLNLVVKWSRVGEEVPLDTLTINKFINAEFNSPFEEFSLVMGLRASDYGAPYPRMLTQKPLAIYVPSERLQLWQTGRSMDKIAAKIAQHPGVELDVLRQYVVLYGWIKGKDMVETAQHFGLQGQEREAFLRLATERVMVDLAAKGYRVIDMKPAHIIVRPRPDETLPQDRHGQLVYALVDYELLERTPEHEEAVRRLNRRRYLQLMARRFEAAPAEPLPAHLKPTRLLGVDYIYGHAESTGGRLWVVGCVPELFNYFLPERWRRTPHTKLAPTNPVIFTRTKDNILLVWKVSRMGDVPPGPAEDARVQSARDYGFNSPFEEVALALELSRAGVKTVYPRAIYMTRLITHAAGRAADKSRYAALSALRTPGGDPAVCIQHDYITIWGFWNGPDEILASTGAPLCQSINAERACQNGLLSEETQAELMEDIRQQLERAGFEDLNLKPDHLLLSFRPDTEWVRDASGRPEARLCNFELVRRQPSATPAPPAAV